MKSLVIATLLGLCASAHANGQFQVEPTRVDLSTQAPAGAIVITNHGHEPLRLEAQAMHWSEDVDGASQLAPTSDVVIRPSILEIPPGASRTLRVGTTATSSASEATYRVFVEELPNPGRQKAGEITVLTRIGVPVFIAPKRAATLLQSKVSFEKDHAVVDVRNTGTSHTKLLKIKVASLHDGKQTWIHEAAGWYVLAGASRRFPVAVATDTCPAGDSLVAELTDEDGHAVTTPLGSCSP